MSRALMSATVADQAGNAIQGAVVDVYEAGGTTPVADMFAASSGGSPMATLTSDARGHVEGWFTVGRLVDLKVTDNAHGAYRPASPSVHLTFADYTITVAAVDVSTDMATQAELDAEAALRVSGDAASVATAAADATSKANAAAAASQPLDSDLTAIAALSTTAYGRALLALADAAAGRTALGLGTAAVAASTAFDAAGAAAAAQAASQPVDSDLTAIAALSTTSFGRSFLDRADASAARTLLGLGTAATTDSTSYVPTATPGKVSGPIDFQTPPTVLGEIVSMDPTQWRTRNTLAAITVASVDGTGENVEPCVLHFPAGVTDQNGATWLYLMVTAGYHNNTAALENPSLRVSNSRTGPFAAITGAPDPIVPKPSYGNNFDQSITMGPDGTLYVLFMDSDTTTTDKTWMVSWAPTTPGGRTYDFSVTPTPVLLKTNALIGTEREQAPVAHWDGTQWHVWAVQLVPANPSGIMHYTGATIAAALATAGSACTITNQPTTPAVLWEHNIVHLGGRHWAGVITAKTGANSVLYGMTSTDNGTTWVMGTRPLLQPQALGQGALWDKGLIYRSSIALIRTGRGGLRLALWYGGASTTGSAVWGIGYTEIWFADAEAPRDSFKVMAQPSRYGVNSIETSLTSGALGLNNMYGSLCYSGELGLVINGCDLTVASAVSSAVMRGGLYIVNDQSNPWAWTAAVAHSTLVSELASTFDGNSATHQGVIRWAGAQNVWVPPRTWFLIAGACQGAAINIQQGKIANTGFSPFGSSGGGYNNTPACCLFATGVSGALPQSFTPAGVGQVDNGLGYVLDSTQPV